MEWVDEGSINNYKYASRTIFSGFVTGQIVWVNKLSIRLLTSLYKGFFIIYDQLLCSGQKRALFSYIL